jgi:hypothetical protein
MAKGGSNVNLHKGIHLDEDQLLWALIDEAELPPPLRAHVSTCPQCRAKKERFEQDLEKLGQTAGHYAPLLKKRVTLPVEKPQRSYKGYWAWPASLGAVVTAALLILVLSWPTPMKITPPDKEDWVAQDVWEANRFMTEISLIAENALPAVYLDISAMTESGFDEGFVEFLVPSVEGEQTSKDSNKRGVTC